MIFLMSESKRYLPYFERELGKKLTIFVEKTPYGNLEIAKNDEVIFVENMGISPMGVAWLLDQYRPDGMGMVSKVGGINKLLDVGDILIVTDYIDNTTCRPKSYIEKRNNNIKIRYGMGEPFCKGWRKCIEKNFKQNRNHYDMNIIKEGTYVCTDGPGFESSSEIEAFRKWGADMVGHWISPFVYYARELDICFVSVAVVSNVFHKQSPDMLNDEKNNQLFGKLYKMLVDTEPAPGCDCQKKNILQYEVMDGTNE